MPNTQLKMELAYPPPKRHFKLVGFIATNNGRTCEMHPYGCGNKLVVERDDHGVGMLLRLRQTVPNEVACYTILPDGSDGCCVAFAAHEYASGENGVRLDGAAVRVMIVYHPDHENMTAWRLYHHNHEYAIGEILEFMNQMN